jgi:hypothetical protein
MPKTRSSPPKKEVVLKPRQRFFTVIFEDIYGQTGTVVAGVTLYNALWHLERPYEPVDNGFKETALRHLPTNAGKLTQRRTLILPEGITPSSIRRLARYLRII